MPGRDVQRGSEADGARRPRFDAGAAGDAPPPFGDLVLRGPPNWTAVGFLGLLGAGHLAFATLAFLDGRWEGYLSLMFGLAFVAAAACAARFRFELAVLPAKRQIRLRRGIGRLCVERVIDFSAISGVRLTFDSSPCAESRIELLSLHDDVECPPTPIPRQQALFLAMVLDVPLTKAS